MSCLKGKYNTGGDIMKAVIFGWLKFPRGSASANYIQYLGCALKKIGYDVYIVTNRGEGVDSKVSEMEWHGLKIKYFELAKNKIRHYLEFNVFLGKIYQKKIAEIGLNEDDLLISYCQDFVEFGPVLKYARQQKCKTVACVVEYFPKNLMSGSMLRKELYTLALKYYIPKHEYILPISTFIKGKYPNNKTLVLPIMADTYEYPVTKKRYNKIKIIYPANGKMKDSLSSMIKAIAYLPPNLHHILELHLTTVSIPLIQSYNIDNIDTLLNTVIFPHGWLAYDELVTLYQECHFLLLAREENQMTLANFPSKIPEAMTYGVIPIASDVGDYTKYYLKDGENAIVFKGDTEQDCMNALKRALSLSMDEVKKMSFEARKTAENRFDYRNWTDSLGRFFEYSE